MNVTQASWTSKARTWLLLAGLPAIFILIGLLIGPLFIAAEAGFLLGLRQDVEAEFPWVLQITVDRPRRAVIGVQETFRRRSRPDRRRGGDRHA